MLLNVFNKPNCSYFFHTNLNLFFLRRQLGDPHFFQNCGSFQYNNNKYHNFERNEDRPTVFLKWTAFILTLVYVKIMSYLIQLCPKFECLNVAYEKIQLPLANFAILLRRGIELAKLFFAETICGNTVYDSYSCVFFL